MCWCVPISDLLLVHPKQCCGQLDSSLCLWQDRAAKLAISLELNVAQVGHSGSDFKHGSLLGLCDTKHGAAILWVGVEGD